MADLAKYAGMKIKGLRKLKKMTQTELAEKLNIGKSAISNYEAGYRMPKQDLLFKLANVFEVDLDTFFPDLNNDHDSTRNTLNSILDSGVITVEDLSKITEVPVYEIFDYLVNHSPIGDEAYQRLNKYLLDSKYTYAISANSPTSDLNEEKDQYYNSKSSYYFYPHSISAGFPGMSDGVSVFEKIELPNILMGKYAGEKNILIMRINGESMNKVIPDGSLIGIAPLNLDDLKDGDIVVYSHQNEYSVKQFYRRGNDVIFKPLSEDPTFTDYVVNENDSDLIVHGKVVIYIVEK